MTDDIAQLMHAFPVALQGPEPSPVLPEAMVWMLELVMDSESEDLIAAVRIGDAEKLSAFAAEAEDHALSCIAHVLALGASGEAVAEVAIISIFALAMAAQAGWETPSDLGVGMFKQKPGGRAN